MCDCGCNTCETKSTLMLNESLAPRAILSEGLKYHMDTNKPLTEHLYRAGSTNYFNLWAEARSLYSRNILEITNEDDLAVLTETDLGHYGLYETVNFEGEEYDIISKDGDWVYLRSIHDTQVGKKEIKVKEKDITINETKVPLDFPIELNEQMDIYDDIANMEFGMDYDQLGDNEKEWVRDEMDNMSMNEVSDEKFVKGIELLRSTLSKEGGAAGLEPLVKALSGLGFSKDEVVDLIKNNINIKQHRDGDYILLPLEEAKKKAKKNNKKLNKPMRDSSGGKAYKVYVKDPKTKKIKTVRFGSGGLRAKINDKKARNAFAKRHKCSTKKDKTKAGYWSCRLPRYAKLLGLKSNFGGFW